MTEKGCVGCLSQIKLSSGGCRAGGGVAITALQIALYAPLRWLVQEKLTQNPNSDLIFGKGMRTATFQFSESDGSVNAPNLFTELPFL